MWGRRWLGVFGISITALIGAALWDQGHAQAQEPPPPPRYAAREHYTKREVQIPMRDGVKLHTVIYEPKDTSQKYPFLMIRTPYSAGPYGETAFRTNLGPSEQLMKDGYIFVYQDVRGCYKSEGTFLHMTPHRREKKSSRDVDESSDTHDSIDWLLQNVSNHNGRVGMWGISYPGFYAAASMIDAHAALKAVSPQAPIADWFFDDFFHHGAFFLPHAFNFFARYSGARTDPPSSPPAGFRSGTPDGYQFFLDLGPLSNVNERHFKGKVGMWNDFIAHPNYDDYWQKRNLLPHLHKVAPAVMTVGGWYDAEDLYGPLKIYRSIEQKNPAVTNVLVMGPWRHGGWARGDGQRLGNVSFGSKTSEYYRANIERPFFQRYLKEEGNFTPPEANVFETGANRWRTFDAWPPRESRPQVWYVHASQQLTTDKPKDAAPAFDEFISDPKKPVPYTEEITMGMSVNYMTDDQRFAGRRPDVLVYQTPELTEAMTFAGPMKAKLWVSTSETDADWVVKVIDVFPGSTPNVADIPRPQGHYQMMVRSEVIRGRFRKSYSQPEPFKPNEPTLVELELQDILHTFKKGHRFMVQIQSTWFPLVDRNPQKFVPNIFLAQEADFVSARHRVHRSTAHPTNIEVGLIPTMKLD